MRFAVNIDSCTMGFFFKKKKLKFLRKYDKNNTFILAKLCPKRGGKEFNSYKTTVRKTLTNSMQKWFNLHDANQLFSGHITSKPDK